MPLLSVPNLDDVFSVLRAGNAVATFFDADGFLREAAASAIRTDFAAGTPTGRYNGIRNPRVLGAIAGNPGTWPTHWSGFWDSATPTGLTVRIAFAAFTDDSLDVFDIRVVGTANINCTWMILLDTEGVPATQGTSFVHSIYRRLAQNTMPGVTAVFGCQEFDGAGTMVAENSAALTFPTASIGNNRVSRVHTAANANTRRLVPFIRLSIPAGTAFDFRLRFGGPQIEPGSTLTGLMLPPAGTIRQEWEVTGAAYRGVLLEERRVNLVTNTRLLGAVTGNPGTLPTGWSYTNTWRVWDTGNEAGVPYVDLGLSGGAGATILTLATVPVTEGQTYTFSIPARLIHGPLTGVTVQFSVVWQNAAGSNLTGENAAFTPNYNPLRLQRFSAPFTAVAGAAFAVLRIRLVITSTLDSRLRFGPPQFEAGAMTSLMLAPAGQNVAADRGQDNPIFRVVSVNGAAQTLSARVLLPAAQQKRRGILQVSDAAFNRLKIGVEPDGTVVAWRTAHQGANVVGSRRVVLGTATYGTPMTVLVSADRGGFSASLNGGAAQVIIEPAPDPAPNLLLGAEMPLTGLFVGQGLEDDATGLNGWLQEAVVSNHRTGTIGLFRESRLPLYAVFSRTHGAGVLATFTAADGTVGTVGASTVRLNGSRLLNEPPRINYVTNPRGEFPGGTTFPTSSSPTSWFIATAGGLSRSITRATRNGVEGVEIAVSGTVSTAGALYIDLEGTKPAAAAGQNWTTSFYAQVITDTALLTSLRVEVIGETTGGVFTAGNSVDFAGTRTAWARRTCSWLATDGNSQITGRIRASMTSNNFSVGATVNFTVFIGGVQLENGPAPTSLILPAAGTLATSSRGGDSLSFPFADLFPEGSGAILLSGVLAQTPAGQIQNFVQMDDGSPANRVMLRNESNANFQINRVIANSGVGAQVVGTFTVGAAFRVGIGFNRGGRWFGFAAGGTLQESQGAPIDTLTTVRIGNGSVGDPANAEFFRVDALASLPSDADFQALVNALPVA